MKNIALIGSTGSIGRQVLGVVKNHPKEFKIAALVTGSPSPLFNSQVAEFSPKLYAAFKTEPQKALSAAVYGDADIIFNAAGGFAGIKYSLAAIEAGKTLALANKETLVCGGEYITSLADRHGSVIIPVDSEHSAIWQCLNFNTKTAVRRLIITASGGPFRGKTAEQLKDVTPEQALAHPTWKMGKKITVDSATLMNKGYEVIEAHVLYGVPYGDIQTVIQPRSIVHSLAEFEDGCVMAQMGNPTMELPIQLALTYPKRLKTTTPTMDFTKAFALEFIPINKGDFTLFDFALECGERGGTLPCAMNAADEEAVYAFLDGRIGFTDIEKVVRAAVGSVTPQKISGYDMLAQTDALAREAARGEIYRMSK